MKNICTYKYAAVPVFFLWFVMTACEPAVQTDNGKAQRPVSPSAMHGYNIPSDPQLKNTLIQSFNLQKGEITASAAAEKIWSTTGNLPPGFSLNQRDIIAYDDKEGTFIVRVIGEKNGKPFNETVFIDGFTHPYDGGHISLSTAVFNFDRAIDENLSIDAFIERIRAGENIKDYMNPVLLTRDGSVKKVVFGDFPSYKTEASLAKDSNGGIKIKTITHTVKYKKLEKGGSPRFRDREPKIKSFDSREPYFTKKDVFNRILSKIDNPSGLIQVPQNAYASELYARAMVLGKGDFLFDDTENAVLKHYNEVYKNTAQTGHIKDITDDNDIGTAVYNVLDEGVKADDYEGTLTVNFCITDRAGIEEAERGSGSDHSEITTVIRGGAKKLEFNKNPDGSIASVKGLTFVLVKADTGDQLSKWLPKQLSVMPIIRKVGAPDANWLEVKTHPVKTHPVLKSEGNSWGYYLILNGEQVAASQFLADADNAFLSKMQNDEYIFIRYLDIEKKAGEDTLVMNIQFEGKADWITLNVRPRR